jgi:hypothetical protein
MDCLYFSVKKDAAIRKMCSLYRGIQLHHQLANNFAGPLLPFIITAAELLIIVCCYSFIKAEPTDNPLLYFVALCIGFLAAAILIIGLRLSARNTKISADLVNVVKQIKIHDIISKFDRKVFKSMYSLKWNVGFGGNGFTITRETIPTIFQDIILANIINLLLVS